MQKYDLAIPTLPCRSVGAATEFYRRLGFEGGAHELNSEYAIFRRGAIELHFFTHSERRMGSGMRIDLLQPNATIEVQMRCTPQLMRQQLNTHARPHFVYGNA